MKRESLAKKDVPSKIWEECHKTVMYTVIRVKENKETKGAKDHNDD